MKKKLLPYIVAFAIFLVSTNSWALMKEVDLSFLVNEAQYICYGQVADLQSEWDTTSGLIFTTVKLEVVKSVKSKSASGIISFKIPGGIVGDIGQKNSNSPSFQLHERVFVFISPDLRLVGECQGKFQIRNDMVVERGLPVNNFIEEINKVSVNSSYGHFSPRLQEQSSFNYTTTRYHWCVENPMGKSIYFNANTEDAENEESECRKATSSWNSCGACFRFSFAGLTTTALTAKDDENIVFWGNRLEHPVLAQTTLWFTPSTGCILEADCEFNDRETWNTNGIDDYDIQTCMLHEFGHYFCLDHSDNPQAIMYAYYQGVQRSLSSDDIAGVKAIYADCSGQPEPPATWNSTYPQLLGSSEKLALLRGYRDRVLLSHPNGLYQVKSLYNQSDELLQILNSDSQIINEAKSLIDKNLPEIKKLINSQEAVLQDVEGCYVFMDHLAAQGSLKTKLWLNGIKNKLERCQQTGMNFFGFKVKNQRNSSPRRPRGTEK